LLRGNQGLLTFENRQMAPTMRATQDPQPFAKQLALAGALLLSFVFGSLHAFSALMLPLQLQYQSDRAGVSFAYALAILCLTGGVFVSRWILPMLGARATTLVCGLLGAAGLIVVARGQSLAVLWLGYGVVFGGVNGVAYSLFLERAARAMPTRTGFAIGMVTAFYGAGAAVCAQWEAWMLQGASTEQVLQWLAVALFAASAIAAVGFGHEVRVPVPADQPAVGSVTPAVPGLDLGFFWLVYFLGAAGGLMAIAHAVPIVAALVGGADWAPVAPTLNAVGNVLGSLLAGLLVDRLGLRRALAVPLVVVMVSLYLLASALDPMVALAGLCACGVAYGALIAVVPLVLRSRFGAARFSQTFGVVFTAWGSAGLLGPFVGGVLYDQTGSYLLALALGAGSAAIALGLLAGFPRFFRPPGVA
jgi:MFS family permease